MSNTSWLFLHIFVLSAFAFAQPLFDLIGRHPEFLVAHHAKPFDVIVLALLLCLGIPLVLVAIDAFAGLFGERTFLVVHFCIIALLATLIVLPAIKKVAGTGALVVVASCIVGLCFSFGYTRWGSVKSFVSFLSPALLIFPYVFLILSPASGLVLSTGYVPESSKIEIEKGAPVVFVIFDELPVTSLMDEQGRIDEAAYPNFAALSREAVWYRNATTVADFTTVSVPAMLTGRYPGVYKLPNAPNYPKNLFTLIGRTYALNVVESGTQMCPADMRAYRIKEDRFVTRTELLIWDLSCVYAQHLLPPDYAQAFPNVTKAWKNFGDASGPQHGQETRVTLFKRFMESIEATPVRSFYFIHVDLPHVPWVYYPSGSRYNNSGQGLSGVFGLKENEDWEDDDWAVQQAFQRHLLQTGYVDKLLGEMVAHLKRKNLYEQCLMIVTSDHGVSFRKNDSRRRLSKGNFEDIVHIPLFIKYPFKNEGTIDDREAETVDILPTIADALGFRVPWAVDGLSLLKPVTGRKRKRTFAYRDDTGIREFSDSRSGSVEASETLKIKIALFGSGQDASQKLFIAGRHRALVGRRVADIGLDDSSLARGSIVFDQEKVISNLGRETGFVHGNLTGHIKTNAPHKTPLHLTIGLNGKVVAVTRTSPVKDNIAYFSAIVPENAFDSDTNRLEGFLISGSSDSDTRLLALKKENQKTYQIGHSLDKKTSGVLIGSDGNVIPLIHTALLGWLDRVGDEKSGSMEFSGWAADPTNSGLVSEILVFGDGELIHSSPTDYPRRDIPEHLGGNQYISSGFWFALPSKLLDPMKEVRVFAVSKGERPVATELNYFYGYKWSPIRTSYRMERSANGDQEIIVSGDGEHMPVRQSGSAGMLEGVLKREKRIGFFGLAFDKESCSIPERILIFADGKFIHGLKTSGYRTNVAGNCGNTKFLKADFWIELPAGAVSASNEIRFFALFADGVARELNYAPELKWPQR
ncbi:MAG: sulfatase-like hydrolase/transferase [Thermodesulfobacteriota bacterium]